MAPLAATFASTFELGVVFGVAAFSFAGCGAGFGFAAVAVGFAGAAVSDDSDFDCDVRWLADDRRLAIFSACRSCKSRKQCTVSEK